MAFTAENLFHFRASVVHGGQCFLAGGEFLVEKSGRQNNFGVMNPDVFGLGEHGFGEIG